MEYEICTQEFITANLDELQPDNFLLDIVTTLFFLFLLLCDAWVFFP